MARMAYNKSRAPRPPIFPRITDAYERATKGMQTFCMWSGWLKSTPPFIRKPHGTDVLDLLSWTSDSISQVMSLPLQPASLFRVTLRSADVCTVSDRRPFYGSFTTRAIRKSPRSLDYAVIRSRLLRTLIPQRWR